MQATANLDEGPAARLRDPPNTIGVRADPAGNTDLDRLVETVRGCACRIDTLFANPGGGMAPLGQITEAHDADTFDRNIKGLLSKVQEALPLLAEGVSVILPGPMTTVTSTPACKVYGASKAAVRAPARSQSLALEDRHFRAKLIVLGRGANAAAGGAGRRRPCSPAGTARPPRQPGSPSRVSEPEEIAKVVLFLASSDASFVNGAELFADGGMAQV
ncbi:SDR family oxidoreductase [Azohydromonas aeria]|uniref:SDR family oxidoreductase n=1 Tax=Azohydromonas aeria TaxID=2590212 RepID=UPI001E3673AB|nr:SDR family oxidoreductase [Azohydromonas aeria]